MQIIIKNEYFKLFLLMVLLNCGKNSTSQNLPKATFKWFLIDQMIKFDFRDSE